MSTVGSSNMLMDNLVDYLKTLSKDCVLKNEDWADKLETLDSIKNAELYISCIEETTTLESFTVIPIEVLTRSLLPDHLINISYLNKDNIPDEYRNTVLRNMNKYIIDTYVELNNYYRVLNGLPDVNEIGLYVEPITGVDHNKMVHQMSSSEIFILENTGVLDQLRNMYPQKKYLNHLGQRKIPIYKARRANKFGLIYCPDIDSQVILNRYKELIEKNRVYTLKTVYSEAFKYGSEYYDNFIELFIKIQAVVDFITEVPEVLIRKEFFDSDTIRDMFLSHGIDHFPDIPTRYQIAMIKNLNTLLKFKSTTRNLVDICSLFGYDNIEIFKYYLLKYRKVDGDGNFIKPSFMQVDEETVVDETSIYDLKFIKVPVEGIADDYIRNPIHHIDYEELVYSDPLWNGDTPHEEVKRKIIETHFSHNLSKYLSIDTIYDMSKLSFEMTYFFNMIFDNKNLEENLRIPVGKITHERHIKLTDLFCFLYMLTYERIGIEDTILDTTSKVLHVTGFNFKADLSELATYLSNKGYTMEQLGISEFTIPKSDIISYKELLNIYTKNKGIYKHVVRQMTSADNIRIYRIYKKIYDSLMISELNTTLFKTKEGQFAETYTNYIKDRDDILYNTILNIRSMDVDEKNNKISELTDAIIMSLEEYLSSEDFTFQFSNISTLSSEMVKEYIYKVINFFKSYTVHILSMNSIYILNDRDVNKVLILDDAVFLSNMYPIDTTRYNIITDRVRFSTKEVKHSDRVYMDDAIFILRNI